MRVTVGREKAGPSRQPNHRAVTPRPLSSAGPVFLALAGCAVCFLGGWRGTDWAAQVYRAGQAAHWGFIIWDPGWYAGTYPLNYSVIYPLAAGYLGVWVVAAASAAGAAFCFDRLVVRQFGRRLAGSWYFAASTVVEVAIGQLPTLAGEALALGSVLCVAAYRDGRDRYPGQPQKDRRHDQWPVLYLVSGLGLGLLAGLSSPVVGAFLAMALLAWGLADFGRAPLRAVVVEVLAAALVFVATAAAPLLFPGPGYFPFGVADLIVVLAICALLASPLVRAARAVRFAAVIYAAVSIGLFAIRTQMGDNDVRLAAYIGVPLVICYLPAAISRLRGGGRASLGRDLRRPRVAAACCAAWASALFLVVWHWSPITEAFDGASNGPSSAAAYYRPLTAELDRLSRGTPVRVEIPPTVHHWESAYVAPLFPLARGWERQLDIAYNGLFYDGGLLRPSVYRSWLLANGVSYVALADAPLDYAATAEAALLRSGAVKGLQTVWRSANWVLWKVAGSPGLVTGPARVRSLSPRSVVVQLSASGRTLLRVRWSPYWSLGPTARQTACISRGPGGWVRVRSTRAGGVDLSMSLIDANHGHCPLVGGVRS
jgi:hypothetical protein